MINEVFAESIDACHVFTQKEFLRCFDLHTFTPILPPHLQVSLCRLFIPRKTFPRIFISEVVEAFSVETNCHALNGFSGGTDCKEFNCEVFNGTLLIWKISYPNQLLSSPLKDVACYSFHSDIVKNRYGIKFQSLAKEKEQMATARFVEFFPSVVYDLIKDYAKFEKIMPHIRV